jgi:hypothetical protein
MPIFVVFRFHPFEWSKPFQALGVFDTSQTRAAYICLHLAWIEQELNTSRSSTARTFGILPEKYWGPY